MKTPVSVFQLCGLLSCYIVSECDELSHMDNIDSGLLTLREPTEEEIMKAVLLKGILDTLTDIPCYETLNGVIRPFFVSPRISIKVREPA